MTTPTDDIEVTARTETATETDTPPPHARHARPARAPARSRTSVPTTDHPQTAPTATSTDTPTATTTRTFRLPRVPQILPRRFIIPVTLGVGIWILIGALTGSSTFTTAFDNVTWNWVLVALVVTQLTVISEAVAISGTTTRLLPLGDLLRLQSATSLTGLLGGTVGRMATVIRYLRQRGLEPTAAFGSGVLHTVAGVAVPVVLLVAFVPFALDQLHRTPAGPSGSGAQVLQLVLYTVTAAGVVGGLDFVVPRVRRALRNRHKPQFEPAWKHAEAVASHPGNVFRLLAASALTQLVMAAGLAAALHAVGAYVNFGGLVLVVCFTSLVGTLAPVPGGIPVMEASYISGLTLFGVPQDLAIAATLLFRACTAYLPPLWGYASLASLRRADAL